MKATHGRFAIIAALLVHAALACSNASGTGPDDPDASPFVPSTEDSSDPLDSGLSEDATDSGTVEPKRMCTDEGWCHTVVPDRQTLRAVWSDGQGVAWTVSEQGNILRWDGTTWIQSHAAGVPLYAIWGSSPTDLWAGGGALTSGDLILPGLLLHGTGATASTIAWQVIPAPMTIRSIWGTSATDVWAVASLTHRISAGDPSFVLHYSASAADSSVADSGAEWEIDPVSTTFPVHFQKVWGTTRDDIWLIGLNVVTGNLAQGRVFHRRPDGDGGLSWFVEQPSAKNQGITFDGSLVTLDGVSLSRSLVYVIRFNSNDSNFYYSGMSDNDGASFTWTQRPTSATGFGGVGALSTIWGTGPDDIWMAGQRGRLRHWDGISWRVAAVALDDGIPMQNAVYAICGSGPSDVWVVGAGIALHKVAQ